MNWCINVDYIWELVIMNEWRTCHSVITALKKWMQNCIFQWQNKTFSLKLTSQHITLLCLLPDSVPLPGSPTQNVINMPLFFSRHLLVRCIPARSSKINPNPLPTQSNSLQTVRKHSTEQAIILKCVYLAKINIIFHQETPNRKCWDILLWTNLPTWMVMSHLGMA